MAKEKEKCIKNLTILLIKATTLLQNIKDIISSEETQNEA